MNGFVASGITQAISKAISPPTCDSDTNTQSVYSSAEDDSEAEFSDLTMSSDSQEVNYDE